MLADEQTAGRGRSGRAWFSPDSLGLWMSILLKSEFQAEKLAPLSIAAAVSAAEALREQSGLDVKVKWPNDLFVGGRKLGGFLVEAAQSAGGVIRVAVLGVGVNVGLKETDLRDDLAGVATSLHIETGREVGRLEVIQAVLPALENCLERFQSVGISGFRESWRKVSSTLGHEVTVTPRTEEAPSGPLFTGTVEDLSESGALVLRLASGGKREVWFGDVTLGRIED